MKKSSKITIAVLVIALLVLMTACSGSNDKPAETTTQEAAAETTATAAETTAETTAEATEATTEEATEKTTEETTATTEETTEQEETSEAEATVGEATIEETVLFEQNDVKVTATKMVSDELWGPGVNLLIENNSAQDILVTCDSLTVNDYMVYDFFSAEVSAGKKSNEVVYLLDDTLIEAGVTTIADINMVFDISNNDSYDTIFMTEPIQLKTSQFTNYKKEKLDEGLLLLDQDGIKIVAKYLDYDEFFGNEIVFYFENNTDKDVSVYCESCAINGFMIDSFLSGEINAGKMLIEGITIADENLKENGIEEIEEVDIVFSFSDSDTYDTILETEELGFVIEE